MDEPPGPKVDGAATLDLVSKLQELIDEGRKNVAQLKYLHRLLKHSPTETLH